MTVDGRRDPAERLTELAGHDLAHLNDQILPWWYGNGVDDELGGVFTCFDNDGTMLSTDKYTWSQGRWAWLMGRIAAAGADGIVVSGADEARDRAARTADFLLDHALLPRGLTVYQMTSTGRPVAQPEPLGALHTSVYADLFAVLGFAGAINAVDSHDSSDADRRRVGAWSEAANSILFSAAHRIHNGTALTQPYPIPPGMTSLAESMMMLNTASELFKATRSAEAEGEAISWARILVDAIGRADGLPADFAFIDPTRETDTLVSRHRTPGHVLELLWFLVDAADAIPRIDDMLGPWMADLAILAVQLGWDEEHGGLLRYIDRDGGQPTGARSGGSYEDLVVRTWPTKLWWPHAEALYATALLAHRCDSDELRAQHEVIRSYTFDTFPAGTGAEWTQIRDRRGLPLDEVVALPVKDPFHIARALLLTTELNTMKGQQR